LHFLKLKQQAKNAGHYTNYVPITEDPLFVEKSPYLNGKNTISYMADDVSRIVDLEN
jgi:hypothetical protein